MNVLLEAGVTLAVPVSNWPSSPVVVRTLLSGVYSKPQRLVDNMTNRINTAAQPESPPQ
jgi:hypothetical protein